jgi:hypothetical protein
MANSTLPPKRCAASITINAVAATKGTGHCLKSHVDTAHLPDFADAGRVPAADLRMAYAKVTCARRRAASGDLDSALLPLKND